MAKNIFVVEDDPLHQEILYYGLTRMGYEVTIAEDAEIALEKIQKIIPDLFLIDLRLPRLDGISLCEYLHRTSQFSGIPRIIVTGVDTRDIQFQGVMRYADDFVRKPFEFTYLISRIKSLLRQRKRRVAQAETKVQEISNKKKAPKFKILKGTLIGSCDEMRMAIEKIRTFAVSDAPVLLKGESGTGKRLAAEIIHHLSVCAGGPFVVINCGAIPYANLEKVLFGQKDCSLHSSIFPEKGKFQSAQGGTLLLRDVDQLPLSLQAKLVGFLGHSCQEPVRDIEKRGRSVRIVATATRTQKKEIPNDAFYEELDSIFYTHILSLPPLRNRGEDSVIIAKGIFETLVSQINLPLKGFSAEALDAIRFYSWPGNVRELVNCVHRAFHVSKGPLVNVLDLGITPTNVLEGALDPQKTISV